MKLHISPTPEALANACASFIAEQATTAIEYRGQFNIALTGGHTPSATYLALSLPPFDTAIDWSKVHVFWSDDRCVPPNSPDSNYRLANETLLQRVPIPAENIHRMHGELPPEDAASKAREEILAHFGEALPVFDLVLLGLGDDGHTASLFPETQALNEKKLAAVANYVSKMDAWRLTFTYPTINKGRDVVFLVEGKAKAIRVKEIIETSASEMPASAVDPIAGELHWFLDQDAASLLS